MAEKPEEVFRFVNLRPVQRIDPKREKRVYARYGTGKSPLHAEISALTGKGVRIKANELAKRRLAKDELEPKDIERLHKAVEEAAGKSDAAAAAQAVRSALGARPSEFLAGDAGRKLHDAVWDRLYAHSLAPESKAEEREAVIAAVRDLHFLSFLAQQDDADRPLGLDEVSAVRPLIPNDVVPRLEPGERDTDQRHRDTAKSDLDEAHARMEQLNQAISDLRHNDRLVQAKEQRTNVTFPLVTGDEIKRASRSELGGPSAIGTQHSVTATRPVATAASTAARSTRRTAANTTSASVSLLQEQTHVVPKMQPWISTAQGRKNLAAGTIRLLEGENHRFEEREAADVIAELEGQKYQLLSGFLQGLPPTLLPFVKQEAKYQEIMKNIALPWYGYVPYFPLPVPAPAGSPTATPAARGIQPLGVGDLLVVRQELMRYAAGEVAHIENVMKSEFHTRSHLRARETEEIVITETEQIEESEKDLQTTERFELQKESQKTIQDQMSLQAGVAVTAGYGPVSITAHADFALSNSTTEASKTASTFAKEVTEKSVSKIMRRAREVRTRRTLERFEEKNEHGFDNKTGTGHVIGIYRWVDKYYKARLINYGRRLMLEFIVPEPAAFFRFLEANKPLEGISLTKPAEPMVSGRRLRPDDLTKWNYNDFIARYGVEGVDPYPAETVRVSAAFAEAAPEAKNIDYAKTSEKLVVPKGYKCYDVYGVFGTQGYDNKDFAVAAIGGEKWGSITAHDVEAIIPISVRGYISAFHVNVVAQCVLTDQARQAWRQKTYDAIMQAYEKALGDYNEQVSAARIQAGVQIEGRNPEFNRKIERDELKKGVLRLLTDDFAQTRVGGVWRLNESFDATSDFGSFGYPEFDNTEALVEGKIIQFFEQAFEWTNITYRFYPYIWGRKENWRDVFPLTDTDPQFIDFLRAGAARVVVPAHPAYTETLLHYMATSEIWNGGSPPTLNDPLYVSIVDELKADAGGDIDDDLAACSATSGYPCLADEWEVKLPTTLVYLQPDDKLPDFTT